MGNAQERLLDGHGEPAHYHYLIGNKAMCEPGGMPILGADGEEYYINPEDFQVLGMPEADMFRWEPLGAFDKSGRQGEI